MSKATLIATLRTPPSQDGHELTALPEPVAWLEVRADLVGDLDADWLHSATVITTSANATMAPIHDRMPVILPQSAWATWLDPQNDDLAALSGLLVPAADSLLTVHPVSTEVNNVRNKGADLVLPVGPSA